MSTIEIPVANGKLLYYAFVAGGHRLLQNQNELNQINVFPVRDKDTGTNLASTIRSVLDNSHPTHSYKLMVGNMANAAIEGARGNSGVIFAQFLHGLSCETINKPAIAFHEFAESVKKSIPYIYESISNPVEGTMLTVIKEWAEFLEAKKDALIDFKKVMSDSLHVLEKSLAETTKKLDILRQTGFVDAGAKGFVLFVKGIVDFLINRKLPKMDTQVQGLLSIMHNEEVSEEKIEFRYCTEAIVKDLAISKKELQNQLKEWGNSIVVAGSEDLCRFHVHTNSPAELFYSMREQGTIQYQKVDDMLRQQEIALKRKWNIALVTDSACDLSQDIIDYYQIHMLPIHLHFGEHQYLDKQTIQAEHVYKFLDEHDESPKTSQINEQSFANLYSQLSSHYDAVIAIHLTDKFSGIYRNSKKAAERIQKETGLPIQVIDSRSLSGALGLLVLKAAQQIEQGASWEEVVQMVEEARRETKIFVSVRDLKYMIRGGRVSKPKGRIANFLGINPVISMDESGQSSLFGKTFSQQASLRKVLSNIQKIGRGKRIWNYVLLHAGNEEGVKELGHSMQTITGKKAVSVVNISPVIGIHAGNGSLSVAVLFDEN